MQKKLSYRKPSQRGGGQYSIAIPMEFIEDMNISENDREIEIKFDRETKEIIMRKASLND